MTGSRTTTILRIDASVRGGDRSLSRALADKFLEAWRSTNTACRPDNDGDDKDTIFLVRDVGMNPPPFISENFIAAAFTPKENRTVEQQELLQASDELIAEFKRADIVLLTTPMYNYGLPASLKAWFDMVIRVDETFTFDLRRGDRPLAPMDDSGNKTLVLLTSTGEFGFAKGGFNELSNHLVPHIRTMSHLLGMDDVHHIGIEYQEFRDDRHKSSKAEALEGVVELATRMANRRYCSKDRDGKKEVRH